MLNRPFVIYWARVFMAGTIGELIIRIFYKDQIYSTLHALVLSFAIVGVVYLLNKKPLSKNEFQKNNRLINHPIANYWARNFLVFSIVTLLFEYLLNQPKLPTLVMLVVSLMLAMIHYFTLDRKTEETTG